MQAAGQGSVLARHKPQLGVRNTVTKEQLLVQLKARLLQTKVAAKQLAQLSAESTATNMQAAEAMSAELHACPLTIFL